MNNTRWHGHFIATPVVGHTISSRRPTTIGAVPSFKEYLGTEAICLPEPFALSSTLQDCITGRVSCRHFSDQPMNLSQLSTVAKAAYGIKGHSYYDHYEFLERPVPSGGGLYPLELYFILRNVEEIDSGVYHYAPLVHGLEPSEGWRCHGSFLAKYSCGNAMSERPA